MMSVECFICREQVKLEESLLVPYDKNIMKVVCKKHKIAINEDNKV